MAASIKRIIRKALPEIIQSKEATTGERLEGLDDQGQASQQSVPPKSH